MILASGAELTWKQFIEQPQFKGLSLNEQIIAYDNYLSYISNIRNSSINFQNKGRILDSPGNPVACIEGMDVVFLIDFTGSMGAYIDNLKLNIISIINTIITQSGGDYRLGLVIFDEYLGPNNDIYGTNVEYTSLPASQRYVNDNAAANRSQWITAFETMSAGNNTSFTTQLNKLNNEIALGDGWSAHEPGGIGFEQILNGIAGDFRSNVSKLVILITDALPGGDDDTYNSIDDAFLQSLVAPAFRRNIRALILSQIDITKNHSYRILADGTNGSYTQDSNLAPGTIIRIIRDICS
jgi:hypothetical protein